jgi:hypothetical protein
MNELTHHERVERVRDGDWFGAGLWRESGLYHRHPDVVRLAMEALAKIATPAWFLAELHAQTPHPLVWPLLYPHPISFWPAFSVGHDLHTLGDPRPMPQRDGERPLVDRLLDRAEVRGAVAELAAAALIHRAAIPFTWFPVEGGELELGGGPIRLVEVKYPQYASESADHDMRSSFALSLELQARYPDLVVWFSLKHDLADGLGAKRRRARWEEIRKEVLDAVEVITTTVDLPFSQQLSVGKIFAGRTIDELHGLGATSDGLALDEHLETRHVIRSVLNRAIGQLPAGAPALVYLQGTRLTPHLVAAIEKRLSRLGAEHPRVAAVVVRGASFTPDDVVPAEYGDVIRNPAAPDLGDDRVVDALLGDHLSGLRAR